MKIAAPGEVAYRMGFISAKGLYDLAQPLRKSGYGEYLLQILKEEGIEILETQAVA